VNRNADFFKKTNLLESIRIEAIRIANWNALAVASGFIAGTAPVINIVPEYLIALTLRNVSIARKVIALNFTKRKLYACVTIGWKPALTSQFLRVDT